MVTACRLPGCAKSRSDSITHVPVGIKLINMGDNGQSSPVHISEPSSYLAVAEIIMSLYADPALSNGQTVDWSRLLTDLPQTPKKYLKTQGPSCLITTASPMCESRRTADGCLTHSGSNKRRYPFAQRAGR